uniref:Alpha-2-macroglobulin family protein n=1 Tax=Oscillatoriales cyanobacterium SpSt-418 TaxID=2282169 RepID=A0A7C3PGR9_9CYAN
MLGLLSLVLVLAIASCGQLRMTPGAAPLPSVTPVQAEKLPDWIESISPTGETTTTAQIRIRFKHPLIPLEQLESDQQVNLLKQFEVIPPLKGQFRFLTPRMVGFQAEQAIPKATRVKVTLKAGLADLDKHRLDRDFTWTFNTESIKLLNLPASPPPGSPEAEYAQPFELRPKLKLTANTELDLNSLRERVQLIPSGKQQSVGLKVDLEERESDTLTEQERFDPSLREWVYVVEPQQDLQKGTRYTLKIEPGIRPMQGNLASESLFSSQIQTYASLAYEGMKQTGQPDAGGAFGRFNQGVPEVRFSNGLKADSIAKTVTITPAAQKDLPLVRGYEGDRFFTLNPWALAPNTRYTVTVSDQLTDVFGQKLSKPVTFTFNTGSVAPDIWVPSGFNIFPAGKDLQLNISTVNLPEFKSAVQVLQPKDLVYRDSAYPDERDNSWLPKPNRWETTKTENTRDGAVETPIPLQQKLGGQTGMLAYGVQARTNSYTENGKQKWREPSTYGMVQITNLGVFAQWFPKGGLVRVHRLSDGAPVANADVQIYLSKLNAKSRPDPAPCATGKTDATGNLTFQASDLRGCAGSDQGFKEAPELLVVAQEKNDWAFTRTLAYSGSYEYGVSAGWQGNTPLTRGVIVPDRNLYQPGETVHFTGFAHVVEDGKLITDKQKNYTLTVEGPNGQRIELPAQTTNTYGTFSRDWAIAKNQPLGFYTVRAKRDKDVEMVGEFRVAEFKPPNFKVDLSLTGLEQKAGAIASVTAGKSLEAKLQSNYLFGAPVENGKVKYTVTRQKVQFQPQGWDAFSFGRQWFYPQEEPEVMADVLQTTRQLDAKGSSTQTIKLENDLPYPMTYRVDAEVSDVSNLAVADSQSFVVLPGEQLIGVKSEFVGQVNKAFPVEVIVTGADGAAIANQRVRLELQRMDYSSIGRLVEGSRTEQDQVQFKSIATAEVTSAQTPQKVTLTPTESGSYRIRASFPGRDEKLATDTQIWVAGNDPVGWLDRYTNNRLELKLDKETYQPGETATVLIQSPYPDAELYLAVVRHNTLYRSVTKVQGGTPRVQFKVTPEMVPNAAVEAVLVRQGKPIAQLEPGSVDKLTRIGFVPFNTKLDNQYLKLEAQLAPTLKPSEEQTVQLRLTNSAGQPVQGQFTVAVVNEAVLQLTGYRPPDLVAAVFAEQPISTRLSDNRPDVVLQAQPSPIEKGWGYGGGFSNGAGSTRTRTDFRSLAYYNGAIATNANGEATVSFKLPDDLTTWRVLALATDGNLHFGQTDTTFATTQPLIAEPLLPQFVRPGDRPQIGVSVINNMGQAGTVDVNGSVTAPLKLTGAAQAQASLASGSRAFRFPVEVEAMGEGKVQFAAGLNNASDRFEVPLEVRAHTITEQVIETGATETEKTIPLNVSKQVDPGVGGLEIALASTLIPQITAPAQQVFAESDLPFLEPAASQLEIAAHLQSLSSTYQQTIAEFNIPNQATEAIERLRRLQRPDGGMASFPGQNQSDPFVTPYAAQAIAQASQVFGQTKPIADSLNAIRPGLTDYLNKILANPGQYEFCKENLCKHQVRLEALMALAALGDRRNDFVADLYAQRDQFDRVSQIKLARYLSQTPGWQGEGQQLTDKIRENLAVTGRSARVNLPIDWNWFHSETVAQAQTLQLFAAQKANPETLASLLQGLLNLRRNGVWQSTYDNAEALSALVAYSQLQAEPPNFEASAQLAGKTLVSGNFQSYQKPSVSAQIPIAELPRDRQTITLKKSGRGVLHYLVAFRYRLQGAQPGRFNGLRVTRSLRLANQSKVLYRNGLYSPDPLTVPAGQVFDLELEIITDHPVDHVVITDPLPAGFEAVDNTFQTTSPANQAQSDSWQLGFRTIYKDKVVAYGDRLQPGVYTLHYLARSVTPGKYIYPGAEARLQYAPEDFGRSATFAIDIQDAS